MAMIESKDRATSDPKARKAVLDEVKKEGVEYVLFWFTDIEGHLKSFAITPSEIEGALNDGMGFDGSSITGFNAIEESDMIAIPDPATWRLMPTRDGEAKVGRLICDVVKPDGQPYEGDPRYVMRRALGRMEAMGFDTFNIGPELEYFLFKDKGGTETLDEGGYLFIGGRSDDTIILQGRSRTYHAKQLAQEAVLDLADGRRALANQIVVC